MKIYLFKVPKECYPRYSYICRYAKPLLKRFKTLLNALQINADVAEPSFGDIKVFYFCQDSDDPPGVKDVCCRHDDKVEQRRLTEEEFATSFGSSTLNDTDVFLAPYEYRKEAKNFMGQRCLFIQKGSRDSKAAMNKSNSTTLHELAYDIAVLLERVIIDTLLERMDVLVSFIELKDATSQSVHLGFGVGKASGNRSSKNVDQSIFLHSASQSWLEAWLDNLKECVGKHLRSDPSSFRGNIMAGFATTKEELRYFPAKQMLQDITHLSGPNTARSDREVRSKVKEMKSIFITISNITQLKTKLERVKDQGEAMEQLYCEMQGIVYRSKISEKPQYAISELEEHVAKEILSVNGVVSVGYRFKTLDIFLDDKNIPKMRENATTNVRHILSTHDIKRYAFHCNQKEITLFRQVGERLTIGSTGGALGGFAKRREDMCVLLAKHVAQISPSVYIQDPGGLTLFAHVLPPQISIAPSDIDIGIAKVVESEKIQCDVRFKNEFGTGLPSTLCTFDDIQWLQSLPVHIWRANGRPGLGIISHPILYRNGTSTEPTKLVQIQDRQSEKGNEIERFAVRGDSGAIVCADDPDDETVHVIAMLIGSPNSNVAEQNPRIQQQYLAFRLEDGLDHLQNEQRANITLYEI